MRGQRHEVADIGTHIDERIADAQQFAHHSGNVRLIGLRFQEWRTDVVIIGPDKHPVAIELQFDDAGGTSAPVSKLL